jgi:hypothetical protein
MPDRPRERQVIGSFAERMTTLTRTRIVVHQWLDEEQPGNGGCDAILCRDGTRWALDLRIVQSFRDHRRDESLFTPLAHRLEREITVRFPRSYILLSLPVGAIPSRKSEPLQEGIVEDCLALLAELPDGWTPRRRFRLTTSGIEIRVSKSGTVRPGCQVVPLLPEDQEAQLVEEWLRALSSKCKQLGTFKAQGFPTILLLETRDTSSVNEEILAAAFRQAAEDVSTAVIDEIFLFRDWRSDFRIFPFKLAERLYPDLPEFEEYRRAQAALLWNEDCGPPYLTEVHG